RMLTMFWRAAPQRGIPIRKLWGKPIYGRGIDWRSACVRVGDVERHVRANRTTKLSDTMPTTITDGTLLFPHELMFIMPGQERSRRS
ncbi:hypothetical protein, partial [Mesorhizobium sp.]|uniref:hypothetical protein n=1 Tax=Mesorhizobium sp. TaxID=1871066 RepID=UPI002636F16D